MVTRDLATAGTLPLAPAGSKLRLFTGALFRHVVEVVWVGEASVSFFWMVKGAERAGESGQPSKSTHLFETAKGELL